MQRAERIGRRHEPHPDVEHAGDRQRPRAEPRQGDTPTARQGKCQHGSDEGHDTRTDGQLGTRLGSRDGPGQQDGDWAMVRSNSIGNCTVKDPSGNTLAILNGTSGPNAMVIRIGGVWYVAFS